MNKEELYTFEDKTSDEVLLINGFTHINQLIPYFNRLQKENEKLHHYKTLYQSLKKQKEEMRDWLEEKIICYENPQNTNLGEYERKIHFDLYNDVLGKLEELEMVTDE